MPPPYAPGSLVLDDVTLDSLYVSTPGSSKKKYNGKSYSCKMCLERITGQSPNEHYRLYHQPSARIRFADQKRAVEVKRSATSKLFECPRCSASFKSPRQIQDHAAGWDGKCVRSSLSVSPAKSLKQPVPSTSTIETPTRQTRSRRVMPSPLIQQSKTVARPLKTPTRTRTGIPQISRTFRAMIRQCYNQRVMSNKEIAEFCNCDVRDVHFSVNNEANDNLDEDQDYLDGKLGDIINIDDFQAGLNEDWETAEMSRVDVKLEMDVDTASQDALSEDAFASRAGSRAEAYPTPESDAPHQQVQGGELDSEEEIENDYIRVADTPEPETVHSPSNDDGVKSTRRKPHARDSRSKSPTKLSRSHRPLRTVPLIADPVQSFVSSLECVTPEMIADMTAVFKAYGVMSSSDLDQLSGMDAFWGDVERYFRDHGLTRMHWLLIQDGLCARAVALRQ